MKKPLLFLIVGLFFINFVLALDCQYTDIQVLNKERTNYYINGELLESSPPFVETQNIWDGKKSIGTTRNYEFYAKNNIAYKLEVTLTYNAEGKQRSQDILLDPLGIIKIEGSYSQDLPFFDSTSIRYDVLNINTIKVPYNEEIQICKTCPNGKLCLDDGKSCQFDNECGYGVCNAFGICGPEKGLCPGGKKFDGENCRDTNLTIIKNNAWWIIITSVLVWYFAIFRRKGEEGKRKEVEKQRKDEEIRRDNAREEYGDIIKRKEEVKKEIEENNQIIENLKQEKEKIENNILSEKEKSKKKIEEIRKREEEEIKKWENKKKNKSLEAQNSIDEEIENIRRKRKKEIEATEKELEESQYILKSKIAENKKLFFEEEKKRKEKEETIRKIEDSRKLMNEFHLNKQGYRVRLNEKGYEILEDGTSFHVFWYCKNSNEKQKDLDGFNIHHIDGDKWNNDYSNLIKIDNFVHNDIHKYNVRWIGYRKGVEILKKYSSIKLPGRVLQELERLDKRKNIIAKKVFRRH